MFKTQLTVRIQDINYGNHLGHDALISLMQEARLQYLAQYGITEAGIDHNGLILKELTVNYEGEGFYGDILDIKLWAENLKRSSLQLCYQITCQDRPIAQARFTFLFFDYKMRKVSRAPEALLDILKPLLDSSVGLSR